MANREGTLLVNPVAITEQLNQQGLKQWWVAEQIGIDRATLSRWLNGRVKWAKQENIKAIAEILQCKPNDLVICDEINLETSKQDQKHAAELIKKRELKELIRNTEDWELFESILTTTIHRNLPQNILGFIYIELAVAAWRQLKIKKAKSYLERAKAIADKCGHLSIYYNVLLNEGTLLLFEGNLTLAQMKFQTCVAQSVDVNAHSSALANLAETFHKQGLLEDAMDTVSQLIKLHQSNPSIYKDTSTAMAFLSKASYLLELRHYKEAFSYAEKSIQISQFKQFMRGIHYGKIVQAAIGAALGYNTEKLFLEAHKTFLPDNDDPCFHFYGAVVAYHSSDYQLALNRLHKAEMMSTDFLAELAIIKSFQSQILETVHNHKQSNTAKQKALQLFKQTGAFERLKRFPNPIF